jgi:hypothetical protein
LTLKPFEGTSPVACRPTNIQQCINNTLSPISGTLEQSSIDTTQAIDCVQSLAPGALAPPRGGSGNGKTPPSTPPPSGSKTSLYVGIGAGVALVCIIGFVVMKRK